MEQLDLIEEVTRNDGSRYYEISNIDQNGIAELAADHGLIKKSQNTAAEYSSN